jgi:hypothetical protein
MAYEAMFATPVRSVPMARTWTMVATSVSLSRHSLALLVLLVATAIVGCITMRRRIHAVVGRMPLPQHPTALPEPVFINGAVRRSSRGCAHRPYSGRSGTRFPWRPPWSIIFGGYTRRVHSRTPTEEEEDRRRSIMVH